MRCTKAFTKSLELIYTRMPTSLADIFNLVASFAFFLKVDTGYSYCITSFMSGECATVVFNVSPPLLNALFPTFPSQTMSRVV
ncbi:hypothetical protein BVRB_5g113010 [Beta vulgaris subsp. vulgaris]|nr:hypothetical protein BVRB_5g113010 [Beta vulgaris subsp. vulgaris]